MDRVIVDTDTASDDAQAVVLAALTDRLSVEAVTVVAGNVAFDQQVENAKYALSLAGVADDVPVYEGAREPLVKDHEHATGVHGEDGLGGDLFPDTDVPTAEGFGPDEIARRCRESSGDVSLLCIGPLTNLGLAHAREPDLPELVDEVWVMGGAVACRGNVTPAAEFNVWADPDAARRVFDAFEVTLVDWGLCRRDGVLGDEVFEAAADADTDLAEFFLESTKAVRGSEGSGIDGITVPDGLAAALLAYPELIEESGRYAIEADEREGLTRGYTSVDLDGVTDQPANARVIESADADGFRDATLAMLRERDPDSAFE